MELIFVNKQISTTNGIIKLQYLTFLFFEFNFETEEIKIKITPTLIPWRNLDIIWKFLIKSIKNEISRIIINEGSITAIVETSDPINFETLYPINVAQFIEIGPGVNSEIEIISMSSSFVINLWRIDISFSIRGIIAYPPPNVNSPILKNVLKRINKFLFFKN